MLIRISDEPFVQGHWSDAVGSHGKRLNEHMDDGDVDALMKVLANARAIVPASRLHVNLDGTGGVNVRGDWTDTESHAGDPLPKPLSKDDQRTLVAIMERIETLERTTLAPNAVLHERIAASETEAARLSADALRLKAAL